MTSLVAIDPGTRSMGLAWFERGTLVSVLRLRAASTTEMLVLIQGLSLRGDQVVVERPVAYGPASKTDPNDLVALSLVAGAVIGRGVWRAHRLVAPSEWKGQVDKRVMAERVQKRLSEPEGRLLFACESARARGLKALAGVSLDVWDAIGIGLWHLGRLR